MNGAISEGSFDYWNLLKAVSRSFYLSIRFLPTPMREPVSVAYLLARVSDSLADSNGVDLENRRKSLDEFREWILGKEHGPFSLGFPIDIDLLPHAGERMLLREINQVAKRFYRLDERNRELVKGVVGTIISGQKWDLEYFGNEMGSFKCCEEEDDLLRYAYQVAGCVGEFWTEVGFHNLGEEFAGSEQGENMRKWGQKFGQGLQLINILRDLHEDLPRGRCYLPSNELVSEGWDGVSALRPEVVQPVLERWIGVCDAYLESGWDYAEKVRNFRVRFATLLPLLLAQKTAAKLGRFGAETVMREKVKISRWTVWCSVARAVRG